MATTGQVLSQSLSQPTTSQVRSFSNNLDQKVHNFVSILYGSTDELFSTKVITVNYSNKWFNEELKVLRSLKDQLHIQAQRDDTVDAWNEFKTIRNKYTKQLKISKNNDNKELVSKLQGDPKKLWRFLKRSINDEKPPIDEVEINGVKVSDPKQLVEKLNEFFVQSIVDINMSIPDRPFVDQPHIMCEWSTFERVDMPQLMNILKSITKKSSDDNVNIDVLRDSVESLGDEYLSIINESLANGYCPVEWRKTIVTPIPKVLRPKKAEELRPINAVPTPDKVLQCIVREQLQKHIDDNDILTDYQSAYRRGHSCETAVNLVLSEWKRDLEEGKIVLAVFLDFRRAFETIDRETMIKVLLNYGISGTVLDWFRSWLSNRTQRTKLGELFSSWCEVNVGLPQGTPLSCLMFALYINAIVEIVRRCKIKLFADDTICWIEGYVEEIAQKIIQLNQDLHQISLFCEARKMKLNISKTKYMVISKSGVNTLSVAPTINGQDIERVYEMKYLGVIIDHRLKFDLNLQYVKKKLVKKISFIQRNKHKYDLKTKLQLFKSLVSSHIDYCSTVLFLATDAQLKELQVLQNRALRAILKCDYRTSVESMLQKLNLFDVKQRINFNVLLMIHKLKLGILPSYLSQNLQFVRDVQPYSLRSGDRFRLPRFLGNQAQNSLFYKGLAMYNDLMTVQCGEDINEFKRDLINYVKINFKSH